MFAGLKPIALPSTEFVLPADVKQHLRIDSAFTLDDAYLARLIAMARAQCESIMRRAFLSQAWQLSLKHWPGRDPENINSVIDCYSKSSYIKLPLAPLQSVTSVMYTNTDGTQFTMPQGNVLGGYNVVTDFEPGRIVLPFSGIWPTEILQPGAPIRIRYVCGFSDAATFQAQAEYYNQVFLGIMTLVGYCYENRIPPSEMNRSSAAAGVAMVVQDMLEPYAIYD